MMDGDVDTSGLVIEDVTQSFGGHRALDEVALAAPLGQITGLIGPNGAGKTTTFNVCSGLLRPDAGTILLFGEDVSARSPAARARRGLGRTYQRLGLFDSLTVEENVRLGREAAKADLRPWAHLFAPPAQRRQTIRAAEQALEQCGITDLAKRQTRDLSMGQRRLVELARAVAGGFRLLLLDEPSSGLDRGESDRFGEVLQNLVATEGLGMLVVEHDMPLVLRICQHIDVLDFGRMIFRGTPAEVAGSDIVRAAYLGSSEVELEPAPAGA